MYYVYMLVDPRDGLPFYVGKGKNKRSQDHFREARNAKCKNKHLERKILQIWRDGLEILVPIVASFDEEAEAFLLECDLIKKIGRRDLGTGPLTNLTNGGEGISGRSLDTIRRNVEAAQATRASWSDERRESERIRMQQAGRVFWARLTDHEVAARTSHIRNYHSNLSDAEKVAWADECRERHAIYNTEEWRMNISESCQRLWDDPQSRIDHGVLIRERKAAMSPEKKERHSRNTSVAVTAYWAAMTPEERRVRTEKLRSGITPGSHQKIASTRREMFSQETNEEREMRISRHVEGAQKVDWQEVNKRVAKRKEEWSEEQKAKYSAKMSAAANRRWHGKEESEAW